MAPPKKKNEDTQTIQLMEDWAPPVKLEGAAANLFQDAGNDAEGATTKVGDPPLVPGPVATFETCSRSTAARST